VLRQHVASQVYLLQCFGLRGAANNIDAADRGVSNGHRLERTASIPLYPAGIISLFIVYVGIASNKCLVGVYAGLRFKPQLLSASRSTAHGARML